MSSSFETLAVRLAAVKAKTSLHGIVFRQMHATLGTGHHDLGAWTRIGGLAWALGSLLT
jgi:hypothetical protein